MILHFHGLKWVSIKTTLIFYEKYPQRIKISYKNLSAQNEFEIKYLKMFSLICYFHYSIYIKTAVLLGTFVFLNMPKEMLSN